MNPTIDHREEVRPGQSIQQTVIDGVSVFAFNLKPGDVQPWDAGEGNRGSNGQFNERAELAYAPAPDTDKYRSIYNVKEGMTQIYNVDYWVKAGFPPHKAANHEWAVLTQFHLQPGTKSPPSQPGFGGLTVHDGQFTYDSPTGDGSYFATYPIKPESWFRPSMEVNWASDDSGWVKITDRDSGKLLGEYHGLTIPKGEWKSLKQGYYRAGGLPEGTIYQTWLDILPGGQTQVPAPIPTSDQATLKQALATLIAIPPQIATLQGILAKIQADVKAILDKGPGPWPK